MFGHGLTQPPATFGVELDLRVCYMLVSQLFRGVSAVRDELGTALLETYRVGASRHRWVDTSDPLRHPVLGLANRLRCFAGHRRPRHPKQRLGLFHEQLENMHVVAIR